MNTIYKYRIAITDHQHLAMKPGRIIHVGLDAQGVPCVWAEVFSTMPDILRSIYVVGTGHSKPEEAREHVGSFIQGMFVWHVYTGA